MSLGYIGYCKKQGEDENSVFYAYSGSNWNDENYDKDAERAYDGLFSIDKSVISWTANSTKKQTEYIGWACTAIKESKARVITECKNAFKRYALVEIDYIALRLLIHIFEKIYDTGDFPEREAFIQ